MKRKIIILSGKIKSGKTTVADYLCLEHNYQKIAIADALKVQLCTFLNNQGIEVSLHDFYTEEGKNRILPLRFPNNLPSTIRGSMQWYGELMKQELGNNFWTDQLIRAIKINTDNVVVEDARFVYEIERIKNSGYLEHNYTIHTARIEKDNLVKNNHISETHLDDYKEFDFIIENNSTFSSLYKQIDNLLTQLG